MRGASLEMKVHSGFACAGECVMFEDWELQSISLADNGGCVMLH